MPISVEDQYNAALSSMVVGDFDVIEKALTNPSALTVDEHRSVAEKLGMHGGFLNAAVNIVSDPTVWIALMLSRRFPTHAFLTGSVPARFVGTANEFTGLSSITRTVEGFFRGTHVPKLIALKMRREQEVTRIGNKIFDSFMYRPNWKEEMPIVSMLMEGQRVAGSTPELEAISTKIRGHMDDLWKLMAKTQKVSGGFQDEVISYASARPFTHTEAPRYLRDYLPHMPLLGPESVMELSGTKAMAQFNRGRAAQMIQLAKEDPTRVWTPSRIKTLTSNFSRYQQFMGKIGVKVYNPRLFQRKRMGLNLYSPEAEDLFITDLNVILQKYIHGAARTYALNAPLSFRERVMASTLMEDATTGKFIRRMPSSDPPIVQIVNQGLDAAGGRVIEQPMTGVIKPRVIRRLDGTSVNYPTLGALRTLVRGVMGHEGEDQLLFGNLMNSIRQKIAPLSSILPRSKAANLEQAMSALELRNRDRRLSSGIVSYFYASTLGLNPLSMIKNLFQPFLTTVPAIGIGPTLEGYSVLKSRVPRYAREFVKQRRQLGAVRNLSAPEKMNLAQEKAFNEVFPELSHTGIRADPRAFEVNEADLVVDAMGSPKFRTYDAYMRFLLQPFTHTELSNQVVTFYGGRKAMERAVQRGEVDLADALKGVPAGERYAAMSDFLDAEAASLVNITQFRPGPGSKTVLQAHIPAPFRMFTSFPVRLMNFFADSTVRGAMTAKQLEEASWFQKVIGGRNLGTMARTYVIGKSITEGLREGLGVDLSDAMGITGPFTGIAPSGQVLSPLPISALPSVMMGLFSFATTRDIKRMQPMVLPGIGEIPVPKVLLPGGVAASRVFRALNQYRPDLGGFVDEDERLMFQGDTSDLILGMLGIPLEKERRMRDYLDEMGANRREIRKYRRAYAVAARSMDMGEMDRVQTSFLKDFPEIGRVAIENFDLRRYEEQARMTSVQRMLTSLGRGARYLEANLYEHDPDLVAPVGFGMP